MDKAEVSECGTDEYDFVLPSVLFAFQEKLKEAGANGIIQRHPDFRFVAVGGSDG